MSIRIAAALIASSLAVFCLADDVAPDPKAEAQRTSELSKVEVALWQFRLEGGEPLKHHPEPLLRWSNPNVGRVYGEVYVWTDKGCPVVIGSPYKWFSPYHDFNMEVKSVRGPRLSGTRDGELFWEPAENDVVFKDVPNAAPVADSASERLRQMRALAADFSFDLQDRRDVGNPATRQQLRLLTKPVFRYDSEDSAVTDGAIFAYVHGTDPEAWLLLESHRSGVKSEWSYAIVRMNSDEIIGRYKDETVWRVDELKVFNERQSCYTIFIVPEKS
jgi:hypothetical protein